MPNHMLDNIPSIFTFGDDIECVHYRNWTKAYPPHTHAEHLTLGIVEEGSVCIVIESNKNQKIFIG